MVSMWIAVLTPGFNCFWYEQLLALQCKRWHIRVLSCWGSLGNALYNNGDDDDDNDNNTDNTNADNIHNNYSDKHNK